MTTLPPPSPLELSSERFPDAPPGLAIRMVLGLRHLIRRLADALTPAELIAFDDITAVGRTHAVAAILHYDIPALLEDGALSAQEIADKRALDADAVHRTLRALATLGYFRLRSDGRFENTRVARALLPGKLGRTREFAIYFASASNVRAWADYAETLRTGKSAFDRVHGMTVWEWFDTHPDEREMFAQAMTGMTTMAAPVVATLYPFSEVKRVCDVGGGRGTLLSELLLRHPHLEGVLCDAPGVVESARDLLRRRGVLDRVELVPGSFFSSVPPGADLYILKNILHDWDDPTCEKIVGTVRAAMQPGQRLLVCEGFVEKNSDSQMAALADLQMMIACSDGRERSRGELEALVERCGFSVGRVFEYPTLSLLEAIAR